MANQVKSDTNRNCRNKCHLKNTSSSEIQGKNQKSKKNGKFGFWIFFDKGGNDQDK